MLTKNVNALYGGSPQTYASALATRITVKFLWRLLFYWDVLIRQTTIGDTITQSGEYALEAPGWVSDINQAALSGTDVPLTWSQEANAYDCVS